MRFFFLAAIVLTIVGATASAFRPDAQAGRRSWREIAASIAGHRRVESSPARKMTTASGRMRVQVTL